MPRTRVNGDFTQVSNVVTVMAPNTLPIGVALTDHTIVSTSNGVIFSGFRMTSYGTLILITNLTDTTSQDQVILGEWRLLPGSYEVKVNVSSGDEPFSFSSDNDALGVWLPLDVDRLWWFHVNVSGDVNLAGIWHVELRRIGASVVQAQCDMTVRANTPTLFVNFQAGTNGAYVGTSAAFSYIGLSIGIINDLNPDLVTSTVACAVQSGTTFIVSFTRPIFPGTIPSPNYFERIKVTDSLGGVHIFASADASISTYNILGSPTGRRWTWPTVHPLFLNGLNYVVQFLGPITP